MESEILSTNLWYFVILKFIIWDFVVLKFISLSQIWMDFLPVHELVRSCIGHVKNIGSLSYADLPCWPISLYNTQKWSIVPQIFKGDIFSIGKLSSSQWLDTLNFITDINAIGSFPWGIELTLFM